MYVVSITPEDDPDEWFDIDASRISVIFREADAPKGCYRIMLKDAPGSFFCLSLDLAKLGH